MVERVERAACADVGRCDAHRMTDSGPCDTRTGPSCRASKRGTVPCRGCIRRGAARPAMVKAGYQCNACADIEEGAY